MSDYLLPTIIFIAMSGMIYAVGLFLTTRRPAMDERIERLKTALRTTAPDPTENNEIIQKAAISLSRPFVPRSAVELAGLRGQLNAAGFFTSQAIPIYASLRLIALVGAGLLGSTAIMALNVPARSQILLLAISLGIGLYLPPIILKLRISRRQKRIVKSLPDILDLLVVSIDVGQSLDASLQQIIDRMGASARDLCTEFRLFMNHLNMGVPRREALHRLGSRAGVPELNSFATVLAQADRFGSSIAESLRNLSESARIRRRQQAEERAQQTAVKLIFPLVLFIFPGIFVVLVGPAAINLYRDFSASP